MQHPFRVLQEPRTFSDTKAELCDLGPCHLARDSEAPDGSSHLFSLKETRYNKKNQPLVTNTDSIDDYPRWESKGGES